MFTDCPSCNSLFRVRAAQLGAADGWVRCGNCDEIFYALERLYDTPVTRLSTPRQTAETAAAETAAAETAAAETAAAETAAAETAAAETAAAETAAAETAAGPPAVNIKTEQADAQLPRIHLRGPTPGAPEQAVEPSLAPPGPDQPAAAPAQPEPGQPGAAEAAPEDLKPEQPVKIVQQPHEALTPEQGPAGTGTTGTDEKQDVLADLPPVFDGGPAKTTASPARVIWASLVIVLSLLAVAQFAWFNRDGLVRAYPALAPWVMQLCESLRCEPIRYRHLAAIELMNKQVSQHPRYQDALLASATLVNNAEFIQPFPDIELLIFATDGQVISRGRFQPGEYLGPDVKAATGMPPGAPFHLGLDLAGAPREAAGFRFRLH